MFGMGKMAEWPGITVTGTGTIAVGIEGVESDGFAVGVNAVGGMETRGYAVDTGRDRYALLCRRCEGSGRFMPDRPRKGTEPVRVCFKCEGTGVVGGFTNRRTFRKYLNAWYRRLQMSAGAKQEQERLESTADAIVALIMKAE